MTIDARRFDEPHAREALRKAEEVLRELDALMSVYLPESEISQFNRAPAGQFVPLSSHTMTVLRQARDLAEQTDGAFDVTVRPLLELWKSAGKQKRLPTSQEIAAARELTGWDKITLLDNGAVKHADGVGIDLGGIAKKYAIDQAAEVMTGFSFQGALINVGGDIRFLGRPEGGRDWKVGVRHPFQSDQSMMTLRTGPSSVCTSGNYERFVEIDGRRYSHIVDPRTGMPADMVPSVTTVSDQAIGGVWATALSILGPEGLKRLPPGVEAMVITGGPEKFEVHMTEDFRRLLTSGCLPSPAEHESILTPHAN